MRCVWLLGTIAAGVITVAGITLDRRETTGPAARPAPAESPSPAPTATSTRPTDNPAAQVAEAYALLATNWNARTYHEALQQRTGLATRSLRRTLRIQWPTQAQLRQLRADRTVQLGAILNSRPDTSEPGRRRARILVDVDELWVEGGRRINQTVTYRVLLRQADSEWRVERFSAVRTAP